MMNIKWNKGGIVLVGWNSFKIASFFLVCVTIATNLECSKGSIKARKIMLKICFKKPDYCSKWVVSLKCVCVSIFHNYCSVQFMYLNFNIMFTTPLSMINNSSFYSFSCKTNIWKVSDFHFFLHFSSILAAISVQIGVQKANLDQSVHITVTVLSVSRVTLHPGTVNVPDVLALTSAFSQLLVS